MDFELVYWHWFVLGIVLMLLEIFIPSFTIFWFGLGALVVGLLTISIDLNFTTQIFIWAIASVIFTILWFKFLKPKMVDKAMADHPREAVIGESGQVIKVPTEGSRGVVRFITPLLGDDEWDFISEDEVTLGDRVHIKDISGNTLVVVKLS
jgi:membrane protein implicated in regulation of membrane protease activity